MSFPDAWQFVHRFRRGYKPLYVAGFPPSREQAHSDHFFGLSREINLSLTTYRLYKLSAPQMMYQFHISWDTRISEGRIIGGSGLRVQLQPVGHAQIWKGDAHWPAPGDADPAVFTRPIGEPAHTPAELQRLPIEEKESYRWLAAFEQTRVWAPVGVEVVTVCDREADLYEMFVLAEDKQASLVIRASADRALAEKDVRKLWAKVERQPLAGQVTLQIPGNQQRSARPATVSVRFCSVKLRPPWRPNQKKLPPVTLTAILVREENPPPEIDEPIEWLLLTNTSVQNFEEALRVIGWYGCRWHIELYHKILKSGCTVEDCRLETADRLQNYIALMSVVAWRLHWLTYINRTDPDLPCTTILTAIEWQALYRRIHRTPSLPSTPPTVRQAVRWIAQLGGFLGRKRDGEPGITLIWRGWQRLQDMADTWYLVNEQSQLVGNR